MSQTTLRKSAKASTSKTKAVKVNFHDQLILNQWLWSFLNPASLVEMRGKLDHPQFEGLSEDGQTRFFEEITRSLFNQQQLDEDQLRRYDLNIVQHWKQITDRRNDIEGHVLNLKYFQYLSLLFTEIYLDYYFNHTADMLDGLNTVLTQFNSQQKQVEQQFQPYRSDDTIDDLNKVAFWNATGSGKTLLMHVNILQYLHYYQSKHGAHAQPEQIILLTPNEGLSQQHLQELIDSGFEASFFDKRKSTDLLGRRQIQIIDINKIADKDGDKTVAAASLEGKNLVLVDEGHRGTGTAAGAWMERRDILCKDGFSFEYSATFGQAVSKADNVIKKREELQKTQAKMLFATTSLNRLNDAQKAQLALNDLQEQQARREALREVYAKGILFDYSYKYFYQDGYGKEANILNMKQARDAAQQDQYLTACLLAFYQQQHLFAKGKTALNDYNLEHPLWVFVGNKVNDDDSDILTILKFLADFLDPKNRTRTLEWITSFVQNSAQLLDNKGQNTFYNRFLPLMGKRADDIYQDILQRFFNANTAERLTIVRIAANTGELRLQLGENVPFGVINVGDEKGLFDGCEKLFESHYLNTQTDSFGASIFPTLNDTDSKTNLLIGSRKFTEGWSSWRVSTMGLLNMGSGEGAQIIQLFGRGVRLKGRDFSLKRADRNEYTQRHIKDFHLDLLQTLNIFGLKADYMEKFREYLEDEGITLNQDLLTLDFKTNTSPPQHRLKTLVLKDGYKDNQPNGFKAQCKLSLFKIPADFERKIKKPHVELDLYPRLQAYSTDKHKKVTVSQDQRQQHEIAPRLMPLFDFDAIYLQLQHYKMQRGYSNIQIDRDGLLTFCQHPPYDWYTLYIDGGELNYDVAGILKQQGILLELLKGYLDRYFKTLKNAYEGQYFTVTEFDLSETDSPVYLCDSYQFIAKEDQSSEAEAYFDKLKSLQDIVDQGKIEKVVGWQQGQFKAIAFDRHLYYPLFDTLSDQNLPFTMTPKSFDGMSELKFVEDLQRYMTSTAGQAQLAPYSMYLLRNADTKNRGLGFATAGNFYPDFLLWLVDRNTGQQWLTLIDPKGIRNMHLDDAKLGLYQEIKNIERQINDSQLILNAFVLSITPFKEIINNSLTQSELEDRHVLFMVGNSEAYLKQMFARVLKS